MSHSRVGNPASLFRKRPLNRAFIQLLLTLVGLFSRPMVATATTDEKASILVLSGASVIPAPRDAAIPHATVVMQDGRIIAVGPGDTVKVPAHARTLDCSGKTIVAGFWNCHVHFIEPKWQPAKSLPADELTANFQSMLTRFGFTTAVDLASFISTTTELRRRIESGEVQGPRILTAGGALYPPKGIPYYLTESLPPEVIATLATPTTAAEAVEATRANFAAGADLLKLFPVTGVRQDGRIVLVNMDAMIAKAAVDEAHRQGKLAFAHPSTVDGVKQVLDAGVDVLAHTIQDPKNWTTSLINRLIKARVSLIPTLTLFSDTEELEGEMREVKTYVEAGGEVLFGTDIGFLTDYDKLTHEFILLQSAGLNVRQILETLTTAPARRFNLADRVGRVAIGYQADLVVLDGELTDDARVFSKVHYTLRNGRIIYTASE